MRCSDRLRPLASGQRGQALVAAVGAALVLVIGVGALGALGKALLGRQRYQRAADLAAISAARSMRDDFIRLFEPAVDGSGRPNPLHLEKRNYLARARRAAVEVARSNEAGVRAVDVEFPDGDSIAPVRVRVRLAAALAVHRPQPAAPPGDAAGEVEVKAAAEAELTPPASLPGAGSARPRLASGGGYSGPLSYRQGKPMRPDVALAFDRMKGAARRAGLFLIINSAYRSDAEQARLFARHPDPRWVAPPGKSLHRNGTELDLAPPAAYGWLQRFASSFGFVRRYAWEPWHYGYVGGAIGGPGSEEGTGRPPARVESGAHRADPIADRPLPAFVPGRFAGAIGATAERWNVPAELLAAQLYAESNFNPFARSRVGALGIAQFMPGTAHSYGLRNPFDPNASIEAQAHLMHDLLGRFGSVPLALAAYNAGPVPIARCHCVPPYPETRAYVAKILGLMGGAGALPAPARALEVRLVS